MRAWQRELSSFWPWTVKPQTNLLMISWRYFEDIFCWIYTERNKDPTPGVCRDKRDHCEMYGEKACTEFPTWAANNCEKTCKICTPGTNNAASKPHCLGLLTRPTNSMILKAIGWGFWAFSCIIFLHTPSTYTTKLQSLIRTLCKISRSFYGVKGCLIWAKPVAIEKCYVLKVVWHG